MLLSPPLCGSGMGGHANRGLRPQWTSPPAIIHPHLRCSSRLFCRQDTLHCGVGKLRRSEGAQPWVQPTVLAYPHPIEPRSGGQNIPLRCFHLLWNFVIRCSFWLFCAGETWGVETLRATSPSRSWSFSLPIMRSLVWSMEIWRRSTLRLYLSWDFAIRRNNYRLLSQGWLF